MSGISRYQQAFINYGSHDNQRLMLEYGFVASCNQHSVVYVDKGTFLFLNIQIVLSSINYVEIFHN